MAAEVVEAGSADRGVIVGLLDEYLQELAAHREIPVGATDGQSYPYLDAYFSEPGRHAYLVRGDGANVGIALIRDPASTGCPASEVAEFYITPKSRRRGLGRDAVASIWRRHPGAWKLQVHARNAQALRFWASCIEAFAEGAPEVTELQVPDGTRLEYRFHVGSGGSPRARTDIVARGETRCAG